MLGVWLEATLLAPGNTRGWLAAGVTDVRRGFTTLKARAEIPRSCGGSRRSPRPR